MIRQGDIFWVELEAPSGSQPGYRHPHVVIQNDVYNSSRLGTVIVCALTSKLKSAAMPGNVLLEPGEAHLPKRSVVNVTQVFTVGRSQLGEQVGTLSAARVREILDGLRLITEPQDVE